MEGMLQKDLTPQPPKEYCILVCCFHPSITNMLNFFLGVASTICFKQHLDKLVGGFNPSEKNMLLKIGSCPKFLGWKMQKIF